MIEQPSKVTNTARDEIETEITRDRQMRRHEELWRRERNKFASATNPYPDFDLGSRGHRNIQRDYEERRAVWEQKRDAMEENFASRRDEIRETGQTLSDEFTISRRAPNFEFSVTAVDPDLKQSR